MRTGRPEASIAEKLEHYTPVPEAGCWLWTDALGHNGYGRMWLRGKTQRAHRVAFEHYVRPLLPGEVVCHRCDTPSCINPAHLFVGTLKDNMTDMAAKGRGKFQKRDRCKNGHPFDRVNSRGHRECLTCLRALWRAAELRKQARKRVGAVQG